MNAPLPAAALDRRTYLGSSDIAAVLGVSPWATPLDVYLRKTSEVPEVISPEKAKLFKRGKRLEPIVVDMLIEEYGLEVTRRSTEENPNRYIDSEHPFLASEIDFEFRVTDALIESFPVLAPYAGTIQNGEAKTVHLFAQHKWGEAETEDMPIEYAFQTMMGLSVVQRDACLVGALFGADNLVPYLIVRDEPTIVGVREKAVNFWVNHVLKRVPPDPINMEDMMKLFARVHGRAVQVDDATAANIQRLRDVRASKKSFELAEEEIEFAICDYVRQQWGINSIDEVIDDARLLNGTQVLATWKAQSRTSIDTPRLKAEKPDIAAAYSKTSHFRVLRPKKL